MKRHKTVRIILTASLQQVGSKSRLFCHQKFQGFAPGQGQEVTADFPALASGLRSSRSGQREG